MGGSKRPATAALPDHLQADRDDALLALPPHHRLGATATATPPAPVPAPASALAPAPAPSLAPAPAPVPAPRPRKAHLDLDRAHQAAAAFIPGLDDLDHDLDDLPSSSTAEEGQAGPGPVEKRRKRSPAPALAPAPAPAPAPMPAPAPAVTAGRGGGLGLKKKSLAELMASAEDGAGGAAADSVLAHASGQTSPAATGAPPTVAALPNAAAAPKRAQSAGTGAAGAGGERLELLLLDMKESGAKGSTPAIDPTLALPLALT